MKKIYPLLPLLFCINFLTAQQTLTGTVTDINGSSLPSATIMVKGTDKGTTTDLDGNFSLADIKATDVLTVSYIGYLTAEMTAGDRVHIGIVLSELPSSLNEVVVTGYSEISAKKRISSVAVLSNEQMENIPHTDINKFLQGNAAGVYSSTISGQPGSLSYIRIRGAGSISAGRSPLYVVDGVISVNGNGSSLFPRYNSPDLLASLNPNDIERITVLKDASATALYGARGSNGVIVIKTKRGSAGKTNITVKSQAGIIMPSFGNLDLMSAEETWNYERKVLANTGFSQLQIDSIRPASMLDNTTNWLDEAFNNGATYNMEVQARGGDEKTRFFVSGGYFDQKGTLIGTDFNRLSLRSNIDHFASERLNFSLNLNGSWSKQNISADFFDYRSYTFQAMVFSPLQGKINPATGQLYTGLENDWIPDIKNNFLYSQPLNPFQMNTMRLVSRLSATYKINESIQFTQSVNADWVDIDEKDYDDPSTWDGLNFNGYLINAYDNFRTLTTQSILKYNTRFGTKHSLDALGLFEYQQHDGKRFWASGKGFSSGKLQTLNSAAEPVSTGGFENKFAFLSFLGQANYSYRDRYIATASFRRDGSSRFGANRRWAGFWSLGASWRLSDEHFIRNLGLLNELRLRTSYGTTGNAEIGDFSSLELYGFGENYTNQPGSGPAQISNQELGWEKSDNLNIGVDFAILDYRVGGTVEWYHRITKDLLLNAPVSATTGFTSALRNVGKMQNSGVEVTLNLVPVQSKTPGNFSWNLDFNISFNDNKVLELPGGADIISVPFGNTIFSEGYPILSLRMKKWAGVNPDDGTPLWETQDGGVTGNLNLAGDFIVGNAEPDYLAGLTNTFHFKGFSLSVLFYTAQGHSKMDYSITGNDSDGTYVGWTHLVEAADFWEQPGDNATRPQPLLGGNRGANSPSTRYLEDASFIRLRNVALSYQLPPGWLQKAKFQGVTLYAQGQNLWTHTKYSRLDPEGPELGVETYRYPPSKSLVFGVDFTF